MIIDDLFKAVRKFFGPSSPKKKSRVKKRPAKPGPGVSRRKKTAASVKGVRAGGRPKTPASRAKRTGPAETSEKKAAIKKAAAKPKAGDQAKRKKRPVKRKTDKAPAKKTALKAKPKTKTTPVKKKPVKVATKPKKRLTRNPVYKRMKVEAASPKKRVQKKTAMTPQKNLGVLVGEVTHYFSKIKVVVVKVSSQPLRVGDKIRVKGKTTHFSQPVKSLQVESREVPIARKGQLVGLKVKSVSRVGDLVFKQS